MFHSHLPWFGSLWLLLQRFKPLLELRDRHHGVTQRWRRDTESRYKYHHYKLRVWYRKRLDLGR